MAKQRAYDVILRGKIIDTVFAQYPEKLRAEREAEMRKSLINHDGYSFYILVRERPENNT
jgi:hypothetical protein